MPQHHLGLFDTPPDRANIRLGLAVGALLFAAYMLEIPVNGVRLPEIDSFVPAIHSVIFVSELIVSAVIYTQASVFRSRALIVLASSYLTSALLTLAYMLSFPGAFAPTGLLWAGPDTAAWLAVFRLSAFPIAAIAYALLKSADFTAPLDTERAPAPVLAGVLASMALAAVLLILAVESHDLLPSLFFNRRDGNPSHLVALNALLGALTVAAVITLFLKRGSVLDIWLLVALWGWLIEQVMNRSLSQRYTLGWYSLHGLILASTVIVMLALIAESNRLYMRLALSTAARERDREARLMSMDAVAAAVAHEVGQPFAAIKLSARAGLNWLKRAPPNPEMAAESFQNTLDAAQRGLEVIKSIRANFADNRGALSQFSLNELACETASLLDRELAVHRVSLQLTLDEALPPVIANRVQIQRVLVNLLTNAIESLSATPHRSRRIAIRSELADSHQVLLEISDTGGGIAPEKIGQIFDPFFTTKPTGTGLGLSLSRTIVEGHGGRLWASPNADHGATFHLQMPSNPMSRN